jgi:hypothetical protein
MRKWATASLALSISPPAEPKPLPAEWRNDHGPECTCFACAWRRMYDREHPPKTSP